MTEASGFWSYVHRDDEQVRGKIIRLAEQIRDEFALLNGSDLELFVDREDIAWGEQWRLRISTALQETTFFIPIVTPRYFASEECRKELMQFAALARSVEAERLLLPILFVNVADLDEDSPDEAKALIAKTQYEDWSDLRLTDESSEDYARAVNRLATRLSEIAAEYVAQPSVVPTAVTDTAESDEEPGISDLAADLQESFPKWSGTIDGFPPILQRVSDATTRATERFNSEGQESFAKRVLIARDLAAELAEPAEELLQQGEQYATLLLEMDKGVRAIITLADEQEEPDDIRSACAMFAALRELVSTSQENEETLREFIRSLKGPTRHFKDLRSPLGKMEAGMRSVIDAQTVMDEWLPLMDAASLDCSEETAAEE